MQPHLSQIGMGRQRRQFQFERKFATIVSAQTGLPVNITMTWKAGALPDGNNSGQRPNLVLGVPMGLPQGHRRSSVVQVL